MGNEIQKFVNVGNTMTDEGSEMTQRVQSLRFSVRSRDDTRYQIEKPEEFTNLYGRFLLEQDWLTVWPSEGFADGDEAEAGLRPYLQAWEIQSDLDCGHGTLRFHFDSAQVERLGPAQTSEGTIHALRGTSSIAFSAKATGHLTRMEYPARPDKFGVSQYLDLAHRRWLRHRQGREPLPSMAYFVFTVLKELGGSRKGAAAMFQIDHAVLLKLSELSTSSGDADNVRKFQGSTPPAKMPDAERAWLEAVATRVVRRLGEYAAGGPLTRISITDFDPLP